MADGVNIDWSLAQPKTDYATTYANAFAAGRAMAQGQIQGNAMQAPQRTVGFAARGGGTGDVMTLKSKIDALPEQDRAAVAAQVQARNEALAHILVGLTGCPLEQRLPIAQHVARTSGMIDPTQITADDVSDAGLQAHLATAMAVEQYVRSVQAQVTEAPPSDAALRSAGASKSIAPPEAALGSRPT
jgi:hypothetical protein